MAELRRKRTAAAPPSVEPLTPLRYASLADILRRSPSGGLVVPALAPRALSPGPDGIYEDDDVVCDGCGAGDREEQLLLCDSCGRGRHTFCLHPVSVEIPDGAWFCADCAPPPPPAVPVVKS
ncbi:hypothetical protein HU200_029427 [Digitaria exilis]|uniref:PHD-type domain-containing protein n=1 Tax=Digitaria exilis TaxID=1010633 RepID=A0A835BZ65_9POAL|nr:hypothetical protein HU200_029427 [Digitaria exilis]